MTSATAAQSPPPRPPDGRRRRALRALHPFTAARSLGAAAVAHAIHGLVLFVAIVGATYVAAYPPSKMLVFSAGSIVLFWIAHVYAAALAHQHLADGPVRREARLIWRECRSSLAMLRGCFAPAVPLLLACAGLLAPPLAYTASLGIALATLFALGFLALRNRRASVLRSLVSGLVAGAFGAGIILAETFWH